MRPALANLPKRRRIGLVGIVAVVLIGVGISLLSKLSLGTHTYVALLSQTAGLRPGESVVVAGVPLGTVQSETVDSGHVRVTFTLSDSIRLGEQSAAEVRVATLLGTHDLQVHPRGSGHLPGDTIPLSRTSVPYNLQDVINDGTDQLQQLDTGKLASAFSSITSALQASGQDVGPAVKGIARLSAVVVNRNQDFRSILAATRSVSDQLAGSASDLLTLMRTSNLFLRELTVRRTVIDNLLVEVQDLSTTVTGLIHDNNARLGPVLSDLHQVLAVLRQRSAQIQAALHTVGVTGRYLDNATGNGPWIDLSIPDPAGDANYCLTSGAC